MSWLIAKVLHIIQLYIFSFKKFACNLGNGFESILP